MRRTTLLSTTTTTMLLALAALAPRGAQAQTQTLPEPGARVRVTTLSPTGRAETVVGTLVAAGGDSLVLSAGGRGEPRVLRSAQVRTLQVSAGRGSRAGSALRYGALSAVAGAAVGALIGTATYEDSDDGWNIFSRQDAMAMTAVGLGGLSGIGGALYGRAYPAERWRDAFLPGTSASVGVRADGGVAVAVSLKL